MPYRFAQEHHDYSDFAPGVVLSGVPGRPVFPVRLTDEIFQRCRRHLASFNVHPPFTVYDPCCGSGYLLTTLAYLHWAEVKQLIGSDIDSDVLCLAERNMGRLTLAGLDRRIVELGKLYEQFGKPSHADALHKARGLRQRLVANHQVQSLTTLTFQANALSPTALRTHLGAEAINIVMTDIPYGRESTWIDRSGEDASTTAVWQLLETLSAIVSPQTVIAITSNKQPRITHEAYHRIEQFQIGKRRTLFYRLRED